MQNLREERAQRLRGFRYAHVHDGVAYRLAAGDFLSEGTLHADLQWLAGFMGALCVTGALGHWLLIRAYEAAEASAVQPFAYLQLVWAAALGVALFGERVAPAVAIGAGIVVAAGLVAWWRERGGSAP